MAEAPAAAKPTAEVAAGPPCGPKEQWVAEAVALAPHRHPKVVADKFDSIKQLHHKYSSRMCIGTCVGLAAKRTAKSEFESAPCGYIYLKILNG